MENLKSTEGLNSNSSPVFREHLYKNVIFAFTTLKSKQNIGIFIYLFLAILVLYILIKLNFEFYFTEKSEYF